MASAVSKAGYRPVAAGDDEAAVAASEVLEMDSRAYTSERKERRQMGIGSSASSEMEAEETTGFLTQAELQQPYHPTRAPDRRALLSRRTLRTAAVALIMCLMVCVGVKVVTDTAGLFLAMPGSTADRCSCTTTTVPQHFQTSPRMFAGPTATGRPAFLAQTVTIDPTAAYMANQPLQTNIAVDGLPAEGMADPASAIFRHMGFLSPYNPSPGFGVHEYALPPGAAIVQVQLLSRHGSRYPTLGSNVHTLATKLAQAKGTFKAKGVLSFLADWEYGMGHEILVPKGRQELFDSGVLHAYMYGSLYNPNSKIIVRTTTQDRMLTSAENFMAGFFGLEWTKNATIELILERPGANNSLAGYLNCPNSHNDTGGTKAAQTWAETYLQNATARFQTLLEGIDWTLSDTYAAQTLCPYETAAYGFSRFCSLFTYDEWVGFGYSIDLGFAGNSGFQAATGRAVGIGYQQELLARLHNHTLGYVGSQINTTLDGSTATFPLNQSLYFDFSHDTNIVSVLTALGLSQFASLLPATTYPGPHNFTVAHVTPFGARLVLELIHAPQPVAADRSGYVSGPPTKYVHLLLNQRTIPLGVSFPDCDVGRVDGWCELETFLRVQEAMPALARYDEACFGTFVEAPYGTVMDGAPAPVLDNV